MSAESDRTVLLTAEFANLVAARVVELLDERARSSGLVDAAGLARVLAVSRAFVYEHADELGAIRLGDGAKARLRFDGRRRGLRWLLDGRKVGRRDGRC